MTFELANVLYWRQEESRLRCERKKATTMRTTKETTGTTKATSKMEFCHGSICIGNKAPTHCICPTGKK